MTMRRARTALADELVELAQEGPGGWQKLVENLVNSQERQERPPAATAP